MVVVEADIAFPLLVAAVDGERLRVVVVGREEATVLHATVGENGELGVVGVLPFLGLTGSIEVERAVADIRDRGEVGLESVVPVEIVGSGHVVLVEVVVGERQNGGADFCRAIEHIGVESVLHDGGRVHIAVRVDEKILGALAGDVSNAVNDARGREHAIEIAGEGEETLVDLLNLGGVLHALGGGASLTECGEKDGEKKGDDAHDDEKFDQGEGAIRLHPGCLGPGDLIAGILHKKLLR